MSRRHAGRRSGWGLRSRVTAGFTAGAVLVSVTLAVATDRVAFHFLVQERQNTAVQQAYLDAHLLQADLAGGSASLARVLPSLKTGPTGHVLIYQGGRWFSSSVASTHHDLPASLVGVVLSGAPATQRLSTGAEPQIAVGVPVPSLGIDYFEVDSLAELQGTLRTIGTILLILAAAIAGAGALIGWWAGRRLLAPLRDVATVAAAIGSGASTRRLASTDADLGPLVSSFNAMVDSLQARIASDARFATDVSHELRSPLTTVQASVDVLAGFRSALPGDGATALDLVTEELARFSKMVQDLLEISRSDAGAAPQELVPVDMAQMVTAAAAAHRRPPVPVSADPGGAPYVVRGDPRRLQRVLANLLDNAERHGGGAVAIGIDRRGPDVVVLVDDAGAGVDLADRQRIFARFSRGSSRGRGGGGGGTGLGLAIAHEHVTAHGGRVWVEDAPGGGARFLVALPTVEETGTGAGEVGP